MRIIISSIALFAPLVIIGQNTATSSTTPIKIGGILTSLAFVAGGIALHSWMKSSKNQFEEINWKEFEEED